MYICPIQQFRKAPKKYSIFFSKFYCGYRFGQIKLELVVIVKMGVSKCIYIRLIQECIRHDTEIHIS